MKRLLAFMAAACVMLTGCSSLSEDAQTALNEKISAGYTESLEDGIVLTQISNNFYKTEQNAYPICPNIYCADPTAVEYNGRLYVFGTNDHQQYDKVGDEGTNTYESIKSFVILSTEDMVNWTYHGIIDTGAVAPWIISSWAPSIVSRVEADGLTHFYLYFSNNGCGVGVITATDPLGPWTDPLGRPFIDDKTEGLTNCPNPFDPGAVIDDNGVGWLSFGAGIAPGGSKEMPGSNRIVQLGDDMLSFASEFAVIPAPYAFEASELNYINDTYVYTYNTSWDSRLEWDFEKDGMPPTTCSMAYMTTKTPLDTDSWEYRGDYLYNPGESGLDYCNNHSHLHKYKDRWVLLHHTMLRQRNVGSTKGGFRSLSVVDIPVDENTLEITKVRPSETGAAQIGYLDPKKEQDGACLFTCGGIGYETENGMVTAAKAEDDGAWIFIKGADFGEAAEVFTAKVKGSGRIEVRLDNMSNPPAAAIEFDSADYTGIYSKLDENIAGVHDMYIMISHKDICLDSWQFI